MKIFTLTSMMILFTASARPAIVVFNLRNDGKEEIWGTIGQSLPGVYASRGVLDFIIPAGKSQSYYCDDTGARWPSFGDHPEKYPITLTCTITPTNLTGAPWTASYIVGSGGVFNILVPFPKVVPVFGLVKQADGTVKKKIVLFKKVE